VQAALDLLVHDPIDAWRWLTCALLADELGCSPMSSSEPGLRRGGSG
jgi:hypothetical protein